MGGWVGELDWVQENEAVGMRCCGLGMGGCVGGLLPFRLLLLLWRGGERLSRGAWQDGCGRGGGWWGGRRKEGGGSGRSCVLSWVGVGGWVGEKRRKGGFIRMHLTTHPPTYNKQQHIRTACSSSIFLAHRERVTQPPTHPPTYLTSCASSINPRVR